MEKFPSQRYLSITFCYPQHLLVYSQCIRHIPIKGRKGHWSKPISTVELFVVIRLKGYRRSLSARNRCGNRTEAARFEELNDSIAEREREKGNRSDRRHMERWLTSGRFQENACKSAASKVHYLSRCGTARAKTECIINSKREARPMLNEVRGQCGALARKSILTRRCSIPDSTRRGEGLVARIEPLSAVFRFSISYRVHDTREILSKLSIESWSWLGIIATVQNFGDGVKLNSKRSWLFFFSLFFFNPCVEKIMIR